MNAFAMHTRTSFIGKNVPLWEPGPVSGRGKSKLFDLTDWSTGSLISATPTRCKRRLLHGSVVLAEAPAVNRQQNSAVKKKKGGKKDWWFYDMFVILTPVCTSFVRARDIYAFLCVLSVVKLCVRRIVFIHCRNHVTCLDHVTGNSDGFCYSCRVSECPTPCKAQR